MKQEEAKKYCQDNVLNYGWDGVQQEHIIDAFVAGAEWCKQKAIEAHWKCCPNLSKDNDQMCKHLADCNRQCLYMTEFINQL